ncbi:MAG: starch synthase, partial [Syntrophothermus sp.]
CLPLVRAVGGLQDTVTDNVTGFAFAEARVKPFNDAVRRALSLYPDRERWAEMQKAGMALDFSWPHSARKYLNLYKRMIETPGVKVTAS